MTIVPCDVDVGVPIWAREIYERRPRRNPKKMEVDCKDIRRRWRWIVEKSEDDADVWGGIPGW